jgi:hypothetical protein
MVSLLSPGILDQETDLTTVVPSVGSSEGGAVLEASWGPAEQRVLLTSELDLVNRFGKPSSSNYERWFTVSNFLAYSGACWAVRAIEGTAKNATVSGAGLLVKNDDSYEQSYSGGGNAMGEWMAKYPGALGNSVAVSMCTNSASFTGWSYTTSGGVAVGLEGQFDSAPGTSEYASDRGASNDEMHIAVIDDDGGITGVPGTILEKYSFLSKASDAKLENGSSNYYKDVINQQSDWLRWSDHQALSGDWGESALAVGQATSPNKDVTAVSYDLQVIEQDLVTGGPFTADEVLVGGTSGAEGLFKGVVTVGSTDYILILNLTTTLFTAGEDIDGQDSGASIETANNLSVLATPYPVLSSKLQAGLDGVAGDTSALQSAYELFDNEDDVDISFLLGANSDATLAAVIAGVVQGRKDCIGILSPEREDVVNNAGSERDDTVSFFDGLSVGAGLNRSYMVADCNWKYQFDKYNNTYRWVPCNGDTAGLMAQKDRESEAWFSPGGQGLKNLVKLAWNPKKADRDVLYQKGINPIASFPGEGALLYGDKTMMNRPSAFDRINVRRLFIILRKSIKRASRSLLFQQNDNFTRQRFLSIVRPYLEGVKSRRGITEFKVVCDDTNNPGDVIDRNEFVGDIYIKPTRSINFIKLNFVAVRTDVDFSEIVG